MIFYQNPRDILQEIAAAELYVPPISLQRAAFLTLFSSRAQGASNVAMAQSAETVDDERRELRRSYSGAVIGTGREGDVYLLRRQ